MIDLVRFLPFLPPPDLMLMPGVGRSEAHSVSRFFTTLGLTKLQSNLSSRRRRRRRSHFIEPTALDDYVISIEFHCRKFQSHREVNWGTS